MTIGPEPRIEGFAIERLLGTGAQGSVYRAVRERLGRAEAVKVVNLAGDGDPVALQRFRHEAEVLGRLDHPGIVRVFDTGATADGRPFLAMELVRGPSLAEVLQERQVLPPEPAARLVEALARAVHHAHDKGVFHRDIKPGNVRLRVDDAAPLLPGLGTPVLVDFGIARSTDRQFDLTGTANPVGTLDYMAPEQLDPDRRAEHGAHTDVWALGVLLHELLLGAPPFTGASGVVVYQIHHSDPPLFSARVSKVPADLVAVCRKCLEKSPRRRYATAAALADDLRRHLDHQPTRARPLGPFGRAARMCRRHRLVFGSVAAVVLALGIATVVSMRAAARATRHASLALDVLTTVTREIVANPRFKGVGMTAFQRDLLMPLRDWLHGYVQGESGESSEILQGDALNALAQAEYVLGNVQAAVGAARQAAALFSRLMARPEPPVRYGLAVAKANLGVLLGQNLGLLQEGLAAFDEAEGLFDGLIAEGYRGRADLEVRRAVCAMNRGNCLRDRDPAAAAAAYEVAIARLREQAGQSGAHRAWLVKALGNLGLVLFEKDLPDRARARPVLDEAVRLAQDNMQRAEAARTGPMEPEARQWLDHELDYREGLGIALTNLGELHLEDGRVAEAQATFRRAMPIYVGLATAVPDHQEFPWSVAMTQTNLALSLVAAKETQGLLEAERLLAAADRWYSAERDRAPRNADLVDYHTRTWRAVAALRSAREDQPGLSELARRVLAELQAAGADPAAFFLGTALVEIGAQQTPEPRRQTWQSALARLTELAATAAHPGVAEALGGLRDDLQRRLAD